MDIGCGMLKMLFRSRFLFNLFNKIMMVKIAQQQKGEKEPVVDVNSILLENGLQMVETGFFRGKKTVSRVKDASGSRFILKTGKIEPFQAKLLQAAKKIEGKLSFKVPE